MLYNWIIGNMGTPGEYQYTKMHWIVVVLVILATICFGILAASKLTDKTKRKILLGIAIFQLGFEILWRFLYLTVKGDNFLAIWPTYPCNLGGVILPIAAILDNKIMKKIFYLFGIVGGLLTFAMPEGIFSTSVFVFPILKSVLQHTGLILIPVFEYVWGSFRPSVKTYPYLVLGCFIHLLNCEVIDRLVLKLEEDFMFFRSGLPFVIPGVPQFITFSVFGLVVFFILSYVLNIPESNQVFQKKSK